MTTVSQIAVYGALIGAIHFIVVGALYGNPVIDRLYQDAQAREPGVRRWPSRPRYLLTQLLGTQVEVYALTAAFVWLRGACPVPGVPGAALFGLLLAAVRVYPRFWNMWIQSTYPARLLAVELVNGTLSTLVIAIGLQLALGAP